MHDLSPHQMQVLEHLISAGFRLIAIAPYENALCVRRGECAALLAPVANGGLRLQAAPTYLVGGNLSARIRRGGREVFVWKQKEIEVTADRNAELDTFRRDLAQLLQLSPPQ
jgi:hypothetical protein